MVQKTTEQCEVNALQGETRRHRKFGFFRTLMLTYLKALAKTIAVENVQTYTH